MTARRRIALLGLAAGLGAAALTLLLAGGGGRGRGAALGGATDDTGRGAGALVGAADAAAADVGRSGDGARLVDGGGAVSGRDAVSTQQASGRAAERDGALAGSSAGPAPASLGPREPWRGRVIDRATRRGIEGARVALVAHTGELSLAAMTDAEGAFELAWPTGLQADLAVMHAEYVDLREALPELVEGAEFVLGAAARLLGRVQPWPPPGASEIAATGDEARAPYAVLAPHDRRRRVESGELKSALTSDGAFVFADVEPGAWNVHVVVPGALVDEAAGVELAPGEERELLLRARRGGALSGFVRRAGGGFPIAGAVVEVRARRRNAPDSIEEELTATAETGDDGGYTVRGLAPGAQSVLVRAPWGAEVRKSANVPESLESVTLDLEVDAPVRLSGRVVDASEAPVANARVFALERGERRALGRALRGREVGPVATTDAQGRFAFDEVPAGERVTVLAAPADGGLAGSVLAGPGADGAEISDVLVRLPAGVRVAGRVLGADGLPAPNAEVELRAVHQSASAELGTIAADPEGFFEFEAAPTGAVVLEGSALGYRSVRQRVDVSPDGAFGVELVLIPTFVVAGRVVDRAGAARSGVAVRLAVEPGSPAEAELEAAGGKGMRHLDYTDPYGRFRFDRLTRGPWVASLHSADWELAVSGPVRVDVPNDEELVLEAQPAYRPSLGAVAGEVWAADGGGLFGMEISGLGRGALLLTDGARFEATGVAPGRRRLTFEASGYVPERRAPVEVPPGGTLDLGRIELQPGTRVTVRVRDADGGKLGGAKVVLKPLPVNKGGPEGARRSVACPERGKGVYRASAAARGAFRLRVSRKGYKNHTEVLVVPEKASHELVVKLAESADGG